MRIDTNGKRQVFVSVVKKPSFPPPVYTWRLNNGWVYRRFGRARVDHVVRSHCFDFLKPMKSTAVVFTAG
jgi:hypothetical protein